MMMWERRNLKKYMGNHEESEPTLRRETAKDISLDTDADDYPQENNEDSDSENEGTFGLSGFDSDDEIDMNIIN